MQKEMGIKYKCTEKTEKKVRMSQKTKKLKKGVMKLKGTE